MSLTTDEFEALLTPDPDDEDAPLGDALAAVAVDVGVDAVAAVRDIRDPS